jgi:MYXO-CTERM domain-containing protein
VQVAAVGLHSKADRAGFEQGFMVTAIETPVSRPAQEWMFIPALLVLGAIVLLQRRRSDTAAVPAVASVA